VAECFRGGVSVSGGLRLKRMAVSDESLEFLALNFGGFKALSLLSCEGFSTTGLEAIVTHCK